MHIADPRFVSEPIRPSGARFHAASMVRGEPGLPGGFSWRDEEWRIEEVLTSGKTSTPDRGELYVRRHTYRLRMDDGAIWNVYFLRQAPKGGSRAAAKRRWYLLSIEE